MTVPEGLGAVSNGELTGERTYDGRTTFTWHTAEPMSSHVVTVAVGDWETDRSTTDDGLPVYTAVDPEQADASRKVLGRIPEIVEWAEENFGPYPFSSTGAIVDRVQDAGYALETQNRPYFPGAPDTVLLVHELAHQWYGNSVSPKTWQDMWLNEGFATYAEWLWEEDEGGDSAQETFDALYDGTYYPDEDADASIWAFPPAEPPDAEDISASPRLPARRDGPAQDPPEGGRRRLLGPSAWLGHRPPPRQRGHRRLHGVRGEVGAGRGLHTDLGGLALRRRPAGEPVGHRLPHRLHRPGAPGAPGASNASSSRARSGGQRGSGASASSSRVHQRQVRMPSAAWAAARWGPVGSRRGPWAT